MAQPDDSKSIDAFLRSLGASKEQIAVARRDGSISRLSGDLVLAQGATLSATELASRAGVEVAAVLSLWRTLGVHVPDEHQPMFSERDAVLTAHLRRMNPVGPNNGDELLRVLGSSLARVAEAAVALYVQTVQPQIDLPETDMVTWAKDLAAAVAAALRLGDSMGAIFAHHMRDAIDRQRTAQSGATDRSLYRLAVGFVDLVGFTPLSLHSSPSELLELITAFEVRAFDVAAAHEGRIVKHIGDEVMFVALDAAAGCAIARDITAEYSQGIEPRGGVAYGEVISRHGDYYGTVVNLASRLARAGCSQGGAGGRGHGGLGSGPVRVPTGRESTAQGLR